MTTSLETLCRQVEAESRKAVTDPVAYEQRFIATARDFAPKAARALLAVLAWLEEDDKDGDSGNEIDEYVAQLAKQRLAAILSQFEQPKENA